MRNKTLIIFSPSAHPTNTDLSKPLQTKPKNPIYKKKKKKKNPNPKAKQSKIMKLLNPDRHQLHKQKGTKIIDSGLLLVIDARIWVRSGCLNNVVGPTW